MRIAFVSAGAAGMYCGTCMHDNTLAAALRRQGRDVALIPLYTPMRTDETDVSVDHVFYGAINVYLEQKSALFRHTPWLVDRLFSGRRVLQWAARRGASSDPRDLGGLTLSVLEGEHGRQRKELERLVDWLETDFRPDVVHLSNSMMSGLARRMKERLDVAVVCSVQGEDLFLDGLEGEYREPVFRALRERAADVDAFVAPSRFYADHMAAYVGVDRDRIHTVPLGLNLEGHGDDGESPPERPLVVGYLARVCPEKGLHLLVEAFRELAEGPDDIRLRIAGYLGERDRPYLDEILREVDDWGLRDRVEYVGEVDRPGKIAFLRSLHVLSVPTVYREPKGLFVLEGLANGVPAVLPRHGSFPEMIDATGGGILVEPGSPQALADGLRQLIRDPERRRELGRRGREAVRSGLTDDHEAHRMVELYRSIVETGRRS